MATTGLDAPPAGSRRHLDRTVLVVVKTLTRVAWVIPWSVWSAIALVGGFASMLTRRRHVVLANVRHARADAPPSRIIAWTIGAQQIATHLRAVIATLRAGFRLPDTTDHLILEGIEGVRPHLGQRGVIIVAPHAGPYTMLGLMGRRWLAEQGFRGELAIVARMFRPFRSGALMQWFMDYFTRAGITVIPVHEPPQVMAKRLKNVLEHNGIVVLLVDEPTPTPSAVVPFFDSAIKMPLGPVRLARATGSVIVPTIASYERGRKMKIRLAEPQSPRGPVKEEMNRLAGALETLVSQNLNQWAMLTPIWIDEKTDTMGKRARVDEAADDSHLHHRPSPPTPSPVEPLAGEGAFPHPRRVLPSPRSEGRRVGDEGSSGTSASGRIRTPPPPEGHSYADLHLHTRGSDGLLHAEEWIEAAREGAIRVIAVTDHDHIETVRDWKARDPEGTRHVIPGVELTARGRIVHLGVLFPGEVPAALPRPGRPLLDLVRWARGVEGSIVVLVHPLPVLWRRQLRGMARAGLLPDAIEARFPFSGNRAATIERAAHEYGLAVLGGSDAHLSPGQIGGHATLFPGETIEDLLQALHGRRTRAVTLPRAGRIAGSVYAMQSLYSWLLPVRGLPGVPATRAALLRRAQAAAQRDGGRHRGESSGRYRIREEVQVS